jgi:RHS repeat-associated protein
MLNCINFHPILNPEDNDLFGYKLDFETTNYFDGNIGKQTWRSKNSSSTSMKSYIYGYDNSDRLLSATYSGAAYFSVPFINYDLNGNIKNLHRNGSTDSSNSAMDRLQYAYSGNKLLSVTDTITWNPDMGDFRDGNTSGNDYTYWSNGSLKSDANKGISLIEYDTYLKKVKQVTFSNTNWIKWFYDGQGSLLKRSNSNSDIWVYSLNVIYKNDSLYQLSFADGRVLLDTNDNFTYEFEYRDYLGNLRLSIRDTTSGSPSIRNALQSTQNIDYYPFGLEHYANIQNENSSIRRFNGILKIDDFGLDLNQAVFRMQDPQLGVWWQQDQESEQAYGWTPYRFGFNNPILYSDALGLFETKEEAEKYANNHEIKTGFLRSNKIKEQNDGTYSINNKRKGTAISKDAEFGVNTAALALGHKNPSINDVGMSVSAMDYSAGVLANRLGSILENRSLYGNPHPETIIRSPSKVLPNIRVPTQTLSKIGGGLKALGRISGVAGLGITTLQYANGDISGTEGSVDAIFGAIGFTGYGAPISLVYFAGKYIYEKNTGQTVFQKPIDKSKK